MKATPGRIPTLTVGVHFGGWAAARKRIDNSILIGVPLLGTLLTPVWFVYHELTWIELSAFLTSYIAVGLGVGIGLHRYFSHRSFRTQWWVAWLLAATGSMAFQGSVLRWVADHRRHHAATDECGDTHSPVFDAPCNTMSDLSGLFHAHLGWMFDNSVTDYQIFGKDLLEDDLIMFFHRTHWLWPILLFVIVSAYGYLLGGWDHALGCLFFAGCFRTTLFHNIVWAVNSIGHTYGYESYPQGNRSRNNVILAWLTFGDGWHNNHHRFPRSAFHGLAPNEIDISGRIIAALEHFGLVCDVIRVPSDKNGRS